MLREERYVVIDERTDVLDSRITRTVIGAVEFNDPLKIQQALAATKAFVGSHENIKQKKKLHLNEFTLAERIEFIDFMAELDFEAKVYINYDYRLISTEAKTASLKFSVQALINKHASKKLHFIIEHAEEYRRIVRKEFMTEDHYLSLLPDALCHVIAYRLDKDKLEGSDAGIYRSMYRQLRERTRLHVYRLHDDMFEETRDLRL